MKILQAQEQAIAGGSFTITSPTKPTAMQQQAVQTMVPRILQKLTDSCTLSAASPVMFPQPCQPRDEGCDGSGVDGCSG